MMLKLNGWQRLWVVLSLTSIIPVGIIVYFNFRAAPDIRHDDAFYKRMGQESLSKLVIQSLSISKFDRLDSGNTIMSLRLPNKHILNFNSDYDTIVLKKVGMEYLGILEEEAKKQNFDLALINFFTWLSSCVLVYLIGWGIGWTWGGFKSK